MFALRRQETSQLTGKRKPFVSFVSGQTANIVPQSKSANYFVIEKQMTKRRSLAPAGKKRRTLTTKPRIIKGRVRVRIAGVLHSLSAADVLKKVPKQRLRLAVKSLANKSKRKKRRSRSKKKRKGKKRKPKRKRSKKKKKKRTIGRATRRWF